jgi:protein-tyrosine kinase
MNTNNQGQNVPNIENPAQDSRIGHLLLELGKITSADVEKISRAQKEGGGLRFGDAALKLGLIKESDIRQVLALQFDYPYLETWQTNYSPDLVAAYHPFSPQVEALRALRSHLMMSWFDKGYKTLAVVSANADEGASFLAANLAVVFSQQGARTLLIDANLRAPQQHTIFNLKENLGLADIIAGRASMDVIKKIGHFVDLSVLGAGTIAPNPQELLNRPNFTSLMNQVADQYDVVLVDTTPASSTADVQPTVARCGGALLVSRLNQTSHGDLVDVKSKISVTGASIVAAVVNDF